MKRKVALVADSTVCLPQELVERDNIHIVPIELTFEGRVYRDGLDLTPTEFYERLEKAKRLPTTSAPSPGTYLGAYREAGQQARSILCLTVSSKLSAIFDSARAAAELARETLPDLPIHVLDSRTAAGAEGFVALAAARAATSGKDLAEVTKVAKEMIPRVNLIVLMDTLHYLAMGGRIPKAIAWAGSILSLKPIIHLSQGEVNLLERPRTRTKGLERLIAPMKDRVGKGSPVHVNVMHAKAPEEAEKIKAWLSCEFDCAELYITEFTPVMGTHTGPGVVALAFYAGD